MAATEPSLFRRVAQIVKSLISTLSGQFRQDKAEYGDAVRDLNKVRATVSAVMIKYRNGWWQC